MQEQALKQRRRSVSSARRTPRLHEGRDPLPSAVAPRRLRVLRT